ncbi:TauD/TfdA dioxygenase family protein [Haliangium ochraceum]|uniref:Taurine dioxygenase n=1 Tax=Haliangium ochraceum (strain DSM 14365 / JCM 11303 / SMP-2) TaxID=502025 RepID=D0LMI9_HALO1|nr:TauD/TfdA family dioxygenase [Haliangium ochraceum]ACY18676.1 Taurine dioxygenase [Haliangium ochraceum DSM 14365]
MISFEPIAALGAEVSGVDLTQPLDDDALAIVRGGLLEHQVLFFREQALTPAQHLAFARRFGEPVGHPAYPHVDGYPAINILENTPERPPKIDTWHTDMTFLERPPLGSILRGVVIPRGGDTQWASLALAWDALSARMQRYLEGLEALHSFAHGFRHSLAEPGGFERLERAVRDNPPVRHPVMRVHPESGRKALFVNRLFTTHIDGLSEAESRAVLGFLFGHLETPEFSCRFRWRPDSVAFWDNRITLHRPVNDYWPAHRRMERITIAGDRPR